LTIATLTHSLDERAAALSLLSAGAVRERAREMLELGLADRLPHFRIDIDRLAPLSYYVADVIRENYPDLNIPLHARWRHFVVAGRDVWSELVQRTARRDAAERARAEFDLAVVSVLLDAGAGPDWRYNDALTGATLGRSEGLALASLRMFERGLFSSDPRDPLRVDAARLASITADELAVGFTADEHNPLAGLDGRAALLARLGRRMDANPQVFATHDTARAGGLFDYLAGIAADGDLPAPAILHALLLHLGPIWPDRLTLGAVRLGDTWHHSAIKRHDPTDELVPLHKLSQWLAYSLIEPLRTAGLRVSDIDGLTGLAEYRNGGLFVDGGVIAPRDPAQTTRTHAVDSEFVVEWRALTVALLDRLAPLVREHLGISAQKFPLGALLEGGTWAAGRKVAREKRSDGSPPFRIISDGTVF
jgi:hypothetical protein